MKIGFEIPFQTLVFCLYDKLTFWNAVNYIYIEEGSYGIKPLVL